MTSISFEIETYLVRLYSQIHLPCEENIYMWCTNFVQFQKSWVKKWEQLIAQYKYLLKIIKFQIMDKCKKLFTEKHVALIK